MDVVVTTGAIRRAKLQANCHQQQANIQLFFIYKPDAFAVAKPTVSKHLMETYTYHIPQTCSSQAGVFLPCLRLLEASGYLEGGLRSLLLAI